MIEKPFFNTNLETEITYLKGVGPNRGSKLKKFGIEQISDLFYHFPRKYIDRTNILKINNLQIGQKGLIVGKVSSVNIKQARKRRFFELGIDDETGNIKCIWFRGISWMSEKFNVGDRIALYGKIEFYNGFRIIHPDFDMLDKDEDPINTGKIISIYPTNSELKSVGLDSRGFRRLINYALQKINFSIPDFFDSKILNQNSLIQLRKAITSIHRPENQHDLKMAIYRLKFNEHFFLQLSMAIKKINYNLIKTEKFNSKDKLVIDVYNQIPFTLTESQIMVLKEIRLDLASNRAMNRLIQGDVGCGKTIVAILAACIAMDNNAQVAIMAPTEILSEQHYNSIKNICSKLDINFKLLTSEIRNTDRKKIYEGLESGEIDIIVGTHALIQEKILFHNLGLSIIDEQHRFGVEHRKSLINKSKNPNVLAMTATPIPRTLSMTLHGDLDISTISELPKNRKKIITKVIDGDKINSAYSFVKDQIKKGYQIYIVYPIIEESETLDLEAADTGYYNIKNKLFKNFKVGYVNGRMKKDERDEQMQSFVNGDIDVLVSTTVIEVGIDNSNASVMLIENAERFGLTQLHQLRGRIGRGKNQGYCFLVQRKNSTISDHRLKVMENTTNGFKISDEDLKLRGPGEFFGKKQHGYMKTKIANISEDGEIINISRNLAFEIVFDDNQLISKKNKEIRNELLSNYSNLLEYINIG